MQIGNPRPLSLLGCIPGTLELEAALHTTFKEYLIRGERFDLAVVPAFSAHPDVVEARVG